MLNRIFAMVKPLALSLAAIALFTLGQSVAKAETVVFTTAGCFGAACAPGLTATASSVPPGATVTFASQAGNVNTSTPSGFSIADLGTLTASGQGTFSTPFTLQINQTLPTAGSATFGGTLTGTLIVNGSDARIVFNQTFVVIGGIRYQLTNLENGNTLFLDTTASSGGVTRISAKISAEPIPEPATLLLLGTGLSGIAAGVRRRRNKAAQK